MAYREPSGRPLHEVVVGPLPIRVVQLVPVVMLALLALVVGGLAVAGVIFGGTVTVVGCAVSRTPGDVVTCEEKRQGTVTQRDSAPRAQVIVGSSGGHHPQRCLKVGNRFYSCGESSDSILARIRALSPGQSLEADNSAAPAYMAIGVSGLLSLVLFVLAASHLRGTMKRRRSTRVRVTPQSLEIVAADGNVKLVPRVAGEHVRVASIPTGRGGPPTACIAYGVPTDETRLVEVYTMNGVVELAPAVDALRVALQGIPRWGP